MYRAEFECEHELTERNTFKLPLPREISRERERDKNREKKRYTYK